MGRLEHETFICLDCETTGLDVKEDRVIEVAAMRFTLEQIIDQYESLVDPERSIPDTSIAIHHITPDMVIGKPKIGEIVSSLIKFIGKDIIIGHGVGFDIELIALAADRSGISHTLRANRTLDTLRMARLYGESPTNSLEQLRQHFNIQFEGPHRAMSDVIVNSEVFKYLAKMYRNTEHIFEALSRPIRLKTMPLGKHKGRPIKEMPLEYLLWAARKEFDEDLLFSIRSEISRRKKGNLFGQVASPFQDL